MPTYTVADLRAIVLSRKYPSCVFSTEDLQNLVDLTFTRLNVSVAVTRIGYFLAVADQQDYAIFDTDDTTTEGLCAEATAIKNVTWGTLGSLNTNDVFNPNFVIAQDILRQQSYFSRPVDLTIIRQKLGAWRDQFGEQAWKIIGHMNDPEAVLRLYNTPTADDVAVFIEYTEGDDLTTLDVSQTEAFWAWFEFYLADAMANYFSQTEGIELLGFATKGDALKYWSRKAERAETAALAKTHGMHGDVLRS